MTCIVRCLFSCCVLSAAALSAAAQTAELQYSPPSTLSTGRMGANHLAVGDFDGDGLPDIAITDGLQKNVAVYLNQGKGSFTAPPVITTLAIVNTAGAHVAGDLNGDGKADLVVSTVAGDQVSLVLLSTGGGHFAIQPPLPGSYVFLSGRLADFNRDGHVDLFLGDSGAPFCLILLGCGGSHAASQAPPQPASQTVTLTINAAAMQNGISVTRSATATLVVHS